MPDIIVHEPEDEAEAVFDPYAALCPFDTIDDDDEEEYDDEA